MPQVHEDIASGHERPELRLVHPPVANQPLVVQAEPLQPAIEVEARRRRSDEEQHELRLPAPCRCDRSEELRDPRARVADTETADDDASCDALRLDGRNRPSWMRNDADRPLVPGGAGLVAHELRVDDEPVAWSRTNVARGKSAGLASHSGGTRLSITPYASRRPATPCSRSMRSRYASRSRRPSVMPDTR